MANEQLTTKGIASTDIVEQRSRDIFKAKLPLSEALFIFYPDKTPNLDGHIEFFGENGSTTVKLFFQLKGTEEDVNYYDLPTEILNYFYRSQEPTFLVLVNLQQGKVYWEHIDPGYIFSVLDIKDMAAFDQKTKRITFREDRLVNQNSTTLADVCKKHYEDKANPATQKEEIRPISKEEIPYESDSPEIPEVNFTDVENKFKASAGNLTEKMMLYHAFVFTLTPFFMDRRGDEKRRKLLSYLGITDAEERFIIENLMNANLLGRTGELIYVADQKEARAIFNHYLNASKIDLEDVTTQFSEYDQNQ